MIDDVVNRITNYLTNGGVFNPEMMPQGPARDLLFDCRDEIERLNAENARLREALQDIFDYECWSSSKSLIACTARDALWPRAALAEKEEK